MLMDESAPTILKPTAPAAMADNAAAPPRKTLAYLDDAMEDEDDDDDDDDGVVVSALTMRQCPRASQYEPPARPQQPLRPSSILRLPTRALRGPTIYGWLWKKGASFKTWKKRFFLLNGATLTYYTQACVVATEVGTRCFELPAKGGLRVAGAEVSDLTQFGLCVTSSSGRVLFLQAGDRAARIKWLGVLQEAAKRSSLDAMIRATRVSDAFKCTPSGPISAGSGGGGGGFADTASSDASLPGSSMSSTPSSEDRDADGGREGDEDAEEVEDADADADDESGPTDMQGWLHVRRRTPSVLNLYKKRFVTLMDGHLTLARDVRTRRPVDKSLEVIAASPWHGHEHGLRLQLEKHKELYVYASSSDEAKRWLRAIHNNL